MPLRRGNRKFIFLLLAAFFLIVRPVFASTADGTISSGDAWSEKIGWLNFATTNGNVHVTDNALTGSIWNQLYGWIILNPSGSGVKNNGEGVLSGSAWGANIGWIDFSGVVINSDGIFSGTANGSNTGIVNFSCTNCLVKTDWRSASARSVSSAPVVNNGGSGLPVQTQQPVPSSSYFFIINNGSVKTNTTSVVIFFRVSNDIAYALLSEDSSFINNFSRINFNTTSVSVPFKLSPSSGKKIIYVKFCNQFEVCNNLVSSSIFYSPLALVLLPLTTSTTPKIKLPISVVHTSTTIGQTEDGSTKTSTVKIMIL